MADIRPFAAIRPQKGLEQRIAALPYDVYNRAEARREVEREPLSFLRIDRAETQLPEGTDPYSGAVYEKAGDTLLKMMEEGSYLQEETPCYYLYELTMGERTQTGIAAVAAVEDYLDQTIRKHENTRKEKEEDRVRHVKACGAQTGPIFLAYRRREELDREMKAAKEKEELLYDFFSRDGIRHRVWRIGEQDRMDRIRTAFGGMKEIYIADGHHRCAAAVRVAQELREQNPDFTGSEPFNYFLAVLFPDDQLQILDYNRVVKDLNGRSREAFLRETAVHFTVKEAGKDAYRPARKGSFGMYLEDTWYTLQAKEEERPEDPVEGLDVAYLQRMLLEPVLGIKDPRTDSRIDFVGGIRGLRELERRVREDCAVAFALYPTSITELFAVADAGRLMPPKSTWFEPKLLSGLFLHRLWERAPEKGGSHD